MIYQWYLLTKLSFMIMQSWLIIYPLVMFYILLLVENVWMMDGS